MKKNEANYNGIIHGLKFFINGSSKDQWLVFPNTWLYDEENNQWYLCEFYTPYPWANVFPWIIKKYPHKIWKVDQNIINNEIFRPYKPKRTTNVIYLIPLLIPLVNGFTAFTQGLLSNIFSSTKSVGHFEGICISVSSVLVCLLIVLGLFKLIKPFLRKSNEKGIVGLLEIEQIIADIKSKEQPSEIVVNRFKMFYSLYFFQVFISILSAVMTFLVLFIWTDSSISVNIMNGIETTNAIVVGSLFLFGIPTLYPVTIDFKFKEES